MRSIAIPPLHERTAFAYYCLTCGADLAESNYEALDGEYFCPVCATERRPSRVPAQR